MKPQNRTLILSITCLIFLNSAYAEDWLYTIKQGDTIWDIGENKMSLDNAWLKILKDNGINSRDTIHPGSKIKLTIEDVNKHASYGIVAKASGEVNVTSSINKETTLPLKPGMILSPGDRIVTGDRGAVLLVLVDKTSILIESNSDVTLTRINILGDADGKTIDLELNLQRGEVEMEANPDHTDDSRYRVQTPSASTAVKGTRFYIQSNLEVSRIGVLSGAVSVGNEVGLVTLPSGNGTKSERNKAPLPPVVLLPAPAIELPPTIHYLPYIIILPTDKSRAVQYRVEIAKKMDFVSKIYDEIVKDNFFLPDSLSDGSYFIRFRGIDRFGIQGTRAGKEFSVKRLPKTPEIKSPSNGWQQHIGGIAFSWSIVKNADKYLLEISKTDRFDANLFTRNTTFTNKVSLNLMEEGRYYYRVSGISASGEQGAFSEIRMFQLFPVLTTPPKAHLKLSFEKKIAMAWDKLQGCSSYQVELSDKIDFSQILIAEETANTEWEQARETPKDYYLRVRGVDLLGAPGPYSKEIKFSMPKSKRPSLAPIYK